MRMVHIVRPYKVGSKTGKSVALVIPRDIVRQYGINSSSLVILRADDVPRKITLQAIEEAETVEKLEKNQILTTRTSKTSGSYPGEVTGEKA